MLQHEVELLEQRNVIHERRKQTNIRLLKNIRGLGEASLSFLLLKAPSLNYRSTMTEALPTKAPPSEIEIRDAIRSLHTVQPRPGIKRIISSLKSFNPDWAPHIRGEFVRSTVRKLDEELDDFTEATELVVPHPPCGEERLEGTAVPSNGQNILIAEPEENVTTKETNSRKNKKKKSGRAKRNDETDSLQP